MNIEQITDKYLDKLYKIDPLHDFMWKKKELVDFAGFVLESVIPSKKKYKKMGVNEFPRTKLDVFKHRYTGFNACVDQIRQKAGLK